VSGKRSMGSSVAPRTLVGLRATDMSGFAAFRRVASLVALCKSPRSRRLALCTGHSGTCLLRRERTVS